MRKMTPTDVKLNLKNFILISFAIKESLSGGAESAPAPHVR